MSSLLAGPKRWWLIGGVVALLTLAIGWLVLVGPQQSATAEAVAKKEQVEQQVVMGAAQNRKLAEQNSELEAVKKQLQDLQNRIPDSQQVSALLVNANNLAGASGISLSSFSPGPVSALETSAPDKGTARLGYMTVTIIGTGSFSQVETYLSKLENLDRALIVTSVGMSKPSSDSGSGGSGSAPQQNPGASGEISVNIVAQVFVRGDAVPALESKGKSSGTANP